MLPFTHLFPFSYQQVAVTLTELSIVHKCNLHIITIVLAKLLAKCTGVTNLMEYFEDVISARREEERLFLLPPLLDHNRNMQSLDINLPHLLLDKVNY